MRWCIFRIFKFISFDETKEGKDFHILFPYKWRSGLKYIFEHKLHHTVLKQNSTNENWMFKTFSFFPFIYKIANEFK